MRKLTPAQIEFVYRRIAGHEKCASCGKWHEPQDLNLFKLCNECAPVMLIPQVVLDEMEQAMRNQKYFSRLKLLSLIHI